MAGHEQDPGGVGPETQGSSDLDAELERGLGEDHGSKSEAPRLEPLPRGIRFALFLVGAVFVGIGLVGLALPVVPQVIPLILGAAVLSLASEALHRRLQNLLEPWPSAAERFRRVRNRLHQMFSRR